jgi:integrase
MTLYTKPNSPYLWYDIRHNNKRYRGSTGTANRKIASQYESTILQNLQAGIDIIAKQPTNPKRAAIANSGCITLGMALNSHSEAIWGTARSYRTFYLVNIRAICTDAISGLDVTKLSTGDLLAWTTDKLEYGNARSTINQKLGIIRLVLDRVQRTGTAIQIIDWELVKLKKATKSHNVWFDDAVEQRIQDHYRGLGHYDIADFFIVLADTGARFNNVSSLLWSDVDLQNHKITFRNTKNGSDITLPMTDRVYNVLSNRTHLETPFASIEYNRVRLSWDRMKKQFNWPSGQGYKMHALRHTCGTRLANAGVDIRVIQEWLGHKDIRQTSKYVQVVSSSLADARDSLQNKNRNQHD